MTSPLCIVCGSKPTRTDSQTCPDCVATTAQHLTDISRWLPEARAHLGRRLSSSTSGGGSRTATDGRPLPGGDLLALTGPGSAGYSETGETTRAGDPRSVAYELTWWARQWRSTYGDPVTVDMKRALEQYEMLRTLLVVRRDAEQLRRGSRPRQATQAARTRDHLAAALEQLTVDDTFRQTVTYLQQRHHQAARSHPGFGQYAADLRDLHELLGRAASRIRKDRRLPAECLDCGQPLYVLVDTRTGLENETVSVCRACHRRYDPVAYRLARSMTVRRGSTWTDDDGEEWATPETTATFLDRKPRTIRDWARRELIRSTVLGSRLFVATGDAAREHAARQRRERERRAG